MTFHYNKNLAARRTRLSGRIIVVSVPWF